MENVCNVVLVKWKLELEFFTLCKDVDDTVQAFISTKDSEEMDKDKVEWYVPKAAALQEFINEVTSWVNKAPVSLLQFFCVLATRGPHARLAQL